VDDDRWLTYDELAGARGTSRDAAIRWVQRHNLRRQPGNDGRVRVSVPPSALGAAPRQAHPRTDTPDAPPAAAFQAALDAIREAHAAEIERLAGIHGAETGRLTGELAAERSRVDALIAGHRGEITAIEAKLTAETARAEAGAAEVAQLRAAIGQAEARLEAEHTHGADLEARIAGLHDLLADAEHRLVDAERGRTTALEQLDAMDRAETERRGKGRWARLRAAWRGE
jgi:hypothetical protein